MPAQPLTHHEILALVEPFARRGRQVDLAASDRIGRCLVFKPIDHPDLLPTLPAPRETLRLENGAPGVFRLTRLLAFGDGLEASLSTDGPDPGELFARIESIDPKRQFARVAGCTIAHVQRLLPEPVQAQSRWPALVARVRPSGTVLGAGGGSVSSGLVLMQGVALISGLTLKLRVPAVRGIPVDIDLLASPGDSLELPQDLLAVQGWNWAPLRRSGNGWSSKLRLRAREPRRSELAGLALERLVRHLATTLAEPPARFHERHRRARWAVVFRRAIPLLTFIALMVTAATASDWLREQSPMVRTLMMHAPLLLLAVSFCLQEMARFEIPPLPRRSTGSAWRYSAHVPASGRSQGGQGGQGGQATGLGA